jgi:hypothetical protein
MSSCLIYTVNWFTFPRFSVTKFSTTTEGIWEKICVRRRGREEEYAKRPRRGIRINDEAKANIKPTYECRCTGRLPKAGILLRAWYICTRFGEKKIFVSQKSGEARACPCDNADGVHGWRGAADVA